MSDGKSTNRYAIVDYVVSKLCPSFESVRSRNNIINFRDVVFLDECVL